MTLMTKTRLVARTISTIEDAMSIIHQLQTEKPQEWFQTKFSANGIYWSITGMAATRSVWQDLWKLGELPSDDVLVATDSVLNEILEVLDQAILDLMAAGLKRSETPYYRISNRVHQLNLALDDAFSEYWLAA